MIFDWILGGGLLLQRSEISDPVDGHRAVDMASPQREVVHPEGPHHLHLRIGQRPDQTQQLLTIPDREEPPWARSCTR
jgi:hypothetical protein